MSLEADVEQEHRASHGECPPSGWDYVFAFPAPSSLSDAPSRRAATADAARKYLLSQLAAASFAYSQLWLPGHALYLVRVAMPEAVLMEKAERMGMRVRLARRFGGGYMAFSRERVDHFDNASSRARGKPFFTPAQRLRITIATLDSRDDWGVDMNINRLFRKGVLHQAFALHSEPERTALLNKVVWSKAVWPWRNNRDYLDEMNDYFGQRIAIYFAWLVFYTRQLAHFVAVSVVVYLCVAFVEDPAWEWVVDLIRILYGISISFWSTYWLEYWQRRNAVLGARWGLTDDMGASVNEIRQDFRGVEIPGFYSQGGFVHLSDLASGPALEDSSSSDGYSGEDQPRREREWLLQRILRGEFWRADEEESIDWSSYSHSNDDSSNPIHALNILSSAAATDRLENPHETIDGQEYVLIGGERDEDFRVMAPVTEAKFDDVPRYPFFDTRVQNKRVVVTSIVTGLFMIIIAVLSFYLTFYKRAFSVLLGYGKDVAWPSGVAMAVLIIVADAVWREVSTALAKWENHHSNQLFENSLIRMRFAFQFVSNYFSLFYIAFVKPFTITDPCMLDASGMPNCMEELSTTLLSIIATKATLEQVFEIGIPYIIYIAKTGMRRAGTQRLSMRDADERRHLLEHGALLDDSDSTAPSVVESKRAEFENTIDDYTEVVILHGFIALFGLSCPLIVAIALASNLIEFRIDCYKLLAVHQRAPAEYAVGIGEWRHILQALSTLSVVTMVGLTTITTRSFHRLFIAVFGKTASNHPLVSFLIFEHVLLFVRWFVGTRINEVPASTYRLKVRREFLIAKFFDVGWKPHFRGPRSDSKREN